MKSAEIRSNLLHEIEGLNAHQLKAVYGLFQNYFNSIESYEEWATLSAQQKEKIEIGIQQANAGNTKPLSVVSARLKAKYGLNG